MRTKEITCLQCGDEFEFTVEDQKYFNARGFDEPKRCPSCRRRKLKVENSEGTMKEKNKKRQQRIRYEF
ncbi:zinc-ribbon domain containing protein [Thermodesulfobacteriota bacterium]